MTNDWIIDVLTDLQKFSATNSMGRLADRLDDTIALATHELSAQQMPVHAGVSRLEQAGKDPRQIISCDNA